MIRYEVAAVLDTIDAGIVGTADASGWVSSLNSEALRLLDRPITDVRQLLGPNVDKVAADHPEVTIELHHASKPARYLRVTRYEPPGSDPATVLVLRDVTEARRAQEFREAFLDMLSHELRTPVTSIHAAATLLRTRQRLEPWVKEGLVTDIAAETDRLLNLVEDLIVLARADEDIHLIGEPVLMQRCVPPAVEREQARWSGLEIDLRVDSDLPVVAGDEAAIKHVVRNLISNAGRYGRGPIVVELRRSTDGAGTEVHVLDQGQGSRPRRGMTSSSRSSALAARSGWRAGPVWACLLAVNWWKPWQGTYGRKRVTPSALTSASGCLLTSTTPMIDDAVA